MFSSSVCKLLVDVGVVEQVTEGKCNRVYRCEEIMDVSMKIDALR